MAKIDATLISTMSEQIAMLPERTTMTPYEVVKQLAPAIEAARERGQDFQAIAKLLASLGVRLSAATVGNYLRRARSEAAPARTPPRALPVHHAPEAGAQPPVPAAKSESTTSVPLARNRASLTTSTPTGGRFELVEDKKDL